MTTRRAGRLLITAGVLVWVVFGAVWLTGLDVDPAGFVPFHLAGVIPGSMLSRWGRR